MPASDYKVEPFNKRIVFEHTRGAYRGIKRIMGTQIAAGITEGQLPPDYLSDLTIVEPNGKSRLTHASLVRVTAKTLEYREIVPPTSGRLNEFHPEQR